MKSKQVVGDGYNKKSKVESVQWITRVIPLILEKPIPLSDLYDMLNTGENVQLDSLLYEHPSIFVRKNVVYFEPFEENIKNIYELLQFIRESFPRTFRKTDFLGIYKYVAADLSKLIYSKDVLAVEDFVFYNFPTIVTLSPAYRDLWNEV